MPLHMLVFQKNQKYVKPIIEKTSNQPQVL